LLLESKADLRKRGAPSPDEGDAVALTFAEPSGFYLTLIAAICITKLGRV
jgi:hypothetical protein